MIERQCIKIVWSYDFYSLDFIWCVGRPVYVLKIHHVNITSPTMLD